MSKWFVALSFLTILSGCATTSKKDQPGQQPQVLAPDSLFLQKYQNSSVDELQKAPLKESQDWWRRYRLAQLFAQSAETKNKACELFQGLAVDYTFPLHDLASLRAQQNCSAPVAAALSANKQLHPIYRELQLDVAIQLSATPSLLLERARLSANLRKKEADLLQALDLAKKNSPSDNDLLKSLSEALEKVAPMHKAAPTASEYLAVANDFRNHRDFKNAVTYYKKIIQNSNSSDEIFSAYKNLRLTYKTMEDKERYLASTLDLSHWAQKTNNKEKSTRSLQRSYEAQLLHARAIWTEGQSDKAREQIEKLSKNLQGLYSHEEIYFLLGRIAEEKGETDQALEYFNKSLQEKPLVSGLSDKVLWLKAWNEYKAQKFLQAVESYKIFKDKAKEPGDKARAAFWLARTYQQLKQNDLATSELQTLTQTDALGYYGVLAQRELKSPFRALAHSQASDSSQLNIPGMDINTKIQFDWLVSLHELSFVEKILNNLVAEQKEKSTLSDNAWLNINLAYAHAGLYLQLFANLGGLSPETKDQLLNTHPELLFPTPYLDEILRSAQQARIEPAYILSIIRQESAFNPEAKSSVDARGLMQLLPTLANQLAKNKNIAYTVADDLYKPEVNIALGAYELKNLLERNQEQYILATASYNASSVAIQNWLKTRFRADPVEFIEEIPYEETRTYIKLVLRNYVFYDRLLNANTNYLFPEKLLKLTR